MRTHLLGLGLLLLLVGLVRRWRRTPCEGVKAAVSLSGDVDRDDAATARVSAACPGIRCVLSEASLKAKVRCPGPHCVLSESALVGRAAQTDSIANGVTRSSPKQQSAAATRGHEWLGGAVGFAEDAALGSTSRRYAAAVPPQNATLLVIGVVSGSKNFDVRNWLRRAFWNQRPWRLGIAWRFVVGTTLPRGDNDRVSLHYEAARHGDLDIVRGSELPPRQARVALRWWLHAAASIAAPRASAASSAAAPPPRYIGLTYDAVLVSLPRLAFRLRSFRAAASASTVDRGDGGTARRRPPRYVYAGPLRWAAWADGASGGAAWRCVKASAPAALVDARLAGDAALPGGGLISAQGRRAAEAPRACRGGKAAGAFLAASPELQIASAPLLRATRAPLLHLLHANGHPLEVTPPADLWDRSTLYHQTAAGRTPSQPALLAATAFARAVHNASGGAGGPLTYLQLHASTDVAAFSWEVDPPAYPGARALLARGVTDGIMAEAVVERFGRYGGASAASAAGRVRCNAAVCAAWGLPASPGASAASPAAACCDEEFA